MTIPILDDDSYGMKYCGYMDGDELNDLLNTENYLYGECLEDICCLDDDERVRKIEELNDDMCNISFMLEPFTNDDDNYVRFTLYVDRVFMFCTENLIYDDDDDEENPYSIIRVVNNINDYAECNIAQREDRKSDKRDHKEIKKKHHFYNLLKKNTILNKDCIVNIMQFYHSYPENLLAKNKKCGCGYVDTVYKD